MTQYNTLEEAQAAVDAENHIIVVPETPDAPIDPRTQAEYKAEQIAEYSRYVAVHPIFIGGARAYSPGGQVSTSQAERENWLEAGYVALAAEAE